MYDVGNKAEKTSLKETLEKRGGYENQHKTSYNP